VLADIGNGLFKGLNCSSNRVNKITICSIKTRAE
jgi:hypothetical protein